MKPAVMELFQEIETTSQQVGRKLKTLASLYGNEKFNGGWRGISEIRVAKRAETGWMIKEHYLHRWPGVTVATLVLVVGNVPCGCVVYALPPRETMKRYGGLTWELARLWVHDKVPRNVETYVIGKSIRWIKRNRPDVVYIVSYADPAFGHVGTIYKASNWRADGRTDQERKTPRIDYRDRDTGQVYSRRAHVPENASIEPIHRSSKWRFVMQLRKQEESQPR